MARDGLCPREHIIHAIRSESHFLGVWLVANPRSFAAASAPSSSPKRITSAIGMHERPAFQGISLDDAAVSYEWLGGSEERDHRILVPQSFSKLESLSRREAQLTTSKIQSRKQGH